MRTSVSPATPPSPYGQSVWALPGASKQAVAKARPRRGKAGNPPNKSCPRAGNEQYQSRFVDEVPQNSPQTNLEDHPMLNDVQDVSGPAHSGSTGASTNVHWEKTNSPSVPAAVEARETLLRLCQGSKTDLGEPACHVWIQSMASLAKTSPWARGVDAFVKDDLSSIVERYLRGIEVESGTSFANMVNLVQFVVKSDRCRIVHTHTGVVFTG